MAPRGGIDVGAPRSSYLVTMLSAQRNDTLSGLQCDRRGDSNNKQNIKSDFSVLDIFSAILLRATPSRLSSPPGVNPDTVSLASRRNGRRCDYARQFAKHGPAD